MTRIEFTVDGKPPKKIRGKSLWTAQSQYNLIKELRERAYQEKEASGTLTFTENVSLKIEVHVPSTHNDPKQQQNFVGDLDNLISGICEGLMGAWSTYKYNQQDPTKGKPIMYNDDSQIQAIQADKIIEPNDTKPYYTVSIKTVS
jgi:Holliday junction resolvase RusA-like endonuclease